MGSRIRSSEFYIRAEAIVPPPPFGAVTRLMAANGFPYQKRHRSLCRAIPIVAELAQCPCVARGRANSRIGRACSTGRCRSRWPRRALQKSPDRKARHNRSPLVAPSADIVTSNGRKRQVDVVNDGRLPVRYDQWGLTVIMMTMLMSAVALSLQVSAVEPALDSAAALTQAEMCVSLPDNRAITACRAALTLGLSPRRAAKAYVFLAEALWSRIEPRDGAETEREVMEAERACRAAIQLDPDQPLAFYLLGLLLERNQEQDAAKAAYARALLLRPAWTAVSVQVAQVLEFQKLGEESAAVRLLTEAADVGDVRATALLAELYSRLALAPTDMDWKPWLASVAQYAREHPADTAQTGRPPARIAPVAVTKATAWLLLGLDDRTLWVTIGGEGASVAEVPGDILVPRPDGFWLARVVHPADNQLPEDILWVRRLGSTARPPRAGRRPVRIDGHDENGCTDRSLSTSIRFVSAAFFGVDSEYESECNGHVNHQGGLDLYKFPPTGKSTAVPLEEVAGASGPDALEEGTTAAVAEEKEKFNLEPDHPADHSEWTVARQRGQWFLRGRLPFRPGSEVSFALNIDVPETLVRQGPLFPSWDIVKDLAPDAVDAFSSPRHDAIVIVTRGQILVYAVRNGQVATRLLVRDDLAVSTPVMVEWAVNRHVARWTRTVRQLSVRRR